MFGSVSVLLWFAYVLCRLICVFVSVLFLFCLFVCFVLPIRYDEAKGDSAILEQMIAGQKPRFKLGSTSNPAAHVIHHQCK